MMVQEIKSSIKKSKKLSVIIIILFSICITFFSVSFGQITNMAKNRDEFASHFENKNLYKLTDVYLNEVGEQFVNERDSLTRLKNLQVNLQTNKQFTYVEKHDQPININNFKGNETFSYGYETGRSVPEIKIEDKFYKSIKAFQMNKNVFLYYNLQLNNGYQFQDKDYIYEPNKSIPAILGYDYLGVYNVGDELNIEYIANFLKINVIGFLKKDSNIIHKNDIVYLDRYILLPSLDFEKNPIDEKEKTWQRRIYFNKINGSVYSPNLSANEVQSIVSNLCSQQNMLSLYVVGATNYLLDIINLQSKEYLAMTLALSIIIFLFSLISLYVTMLNKINSNMKAYSIHLINGAKVKDIKLFIIGEVLFYMICANFIAYFSTIMILGHDNKYSFYIFLVSALFGVLSMIIPTRKINKIDISKLLRSEK